MVSTHRFDVLAAAFLVIRLVLFFPLVEVDFEPVLFDFVRQQSVPVGPRLFLLKGELDGSGADSKLGFLQSKPIVYYYAIPPLCILY